MNKLLRRPKKWLMIALGCWGISLIVVFTIEPSYWLIESGVVLLFIVGFLALLNWINIARFWRVLLVLWLVGVVIANRFGALDLLTFGISLGLLGLFALGRGRL